MYISESDIFFDLGGRYALSISRASLWKEFFKELLLLPFTVALKLCRTALRLAGLVWSVVFVLSSLGCLSSARLFFVDRMAAVSRDLADWFLFPLSILNCLCKFLFGAKAD